MAENCHGCGSPFGIFSWASVCPTADGGCGQSFCSNCFKYCCVTAENAARSGLAAPVSTFCLPCMKKQSSLDFSTHYTIHGPEAGTAPSILFLHGGGGSRAMFDIQAKFLARAGFRCVLIDLPGHGAAVEQVLTKETALNAISQALQDFTAPYNGMAPMLIGGSLGGYLTMEFMAVHPQSISSAVIAMCGQNVGVNRSFIATVGLTAMDWIVPLLGPSTLLSGLVSETKKNAQIEESILIDLTLRPGMFFSQSHAQVEILRETNPAAGLMQFQGPVLFANGSLDHRDSEQIWLACSIKGKHILYEGGDHFFSHDRRFLQSFMDSILSFAAEAFNFTVIEQHQDEARAVSPAVEAK